MKIKQALIWGAKNLKEIKTSALDAEVLLSFILKRNKTWLFLNLDNQLSAKQIEKYKKLIFRRKKGEPVAYITQHKEFFGLDFYVDENVLIPRPETELLVEEAIKKINQITKSPNHQTTILDIGTGSGAIIVSIIVNSKELTDTNYYATDISNMTLNVAKKNAEKHKALSKIRFIKSDLFPISSHNEGVNFTRPLEKYTNYFDLIVANLPYLDPKWISKELKYEPIVALDGGKDGLEIIKNFLSTASKYLSNDGLVMLEIDPRQAQKIKIIAKKYLRNKNILIKKDLAHLDRVVVLS